MDIYDNGTLDARRPAKSQPQTVPHGPPLSHKQPKSAKNYSPNAKKDVDPAAADILIIDSSFNNKKYKAKIIDKVFEKLKAQSVLV